MGHSVHQAADVISGLLSKERTEPTPAAPDTPDAPPIESTQVASQEPAPVSVQAPEISPATETAGQDAQARGPDAPPREGESPEAVSETQLEDVVEEIELDPQQLASFFGVDEDDFHLTEEGQIAVRAKVDGQTNEVSLKDLKDSYQLTKTSQQRLQKLSEDRKTFETERTTSLESLGQQQQFMGQALQAIEQQYAQDWQNVDWQRLRADDPETYATRRQDYDDRARKVAQFKQLFVEASSQVAAENQKSRETSFQEGFQRLNETFSSTPYKTSPKWDEGERGRLANWMVEQGFDQKEMGNVSSWLVFKWARDSMLRADEGTAAKQAVKRVLKLPKVKSAKPGTSSVKGSSKQNDIDAAKARQRRAAKPGNNPYTRKSNLRETTDLIAKLLRS